ncbi:MAG: glycosyltransferase family 4 protein [Thalassobaculales bacterium]
MAPPEVLALAAAAGLAAFLGARALAAALPRWNVLDRPNARSSHVRPTPRGGGIAVIAAIAAGWLALDAAVLWPAVALALALAGLSFADDIRSLPATVRLAAHLAAVIALMPAVGPVTGGLLPPALDLALAGFAWLWFVNLFNFMDGIDGISGVEAAIIGLGLALLVPDLAGPGLVVAGAAIGFLLVNWHPARIFLGDVGSVPLGFLLGFLLLTAAARGDWVAALVLPAYYLADATLTLLRRAWRGERLTEAHRQHFYQHAVRSGRSHAAVAGAVGLAGAALIGCAHLPAAAALPAALLVVAGLIAWMTRRPALPQ